MSQCLTRYHAQENLPWDLAAQLRYEFANWRVELKSAHLDVGIEGQGS